MTAKTCGAKTRAGHPCKRRAMANGRCDFHGGKSLAGVAHPSFKHGRNIKVENLPPRMFEYAMAAMNDTKLASMRNDIVVLEARISDLITRVDSGESGRIWREMREVIKEYNREQDERRKRAIFAELVQLVDDGIADYDAWDEVSKIMDQRARLIAAEQKRLQVNNEMIPVDRVLAVIGSIMGAVQEQVDDPVKVSAIVRHVSRVVNAGDQSFIDVGGT